MSIRIEAGGINTRIRESFCPIMSVKIVFLKNNHNNKEIIEGGYAMVHTTMHSHKRAKERLHSKSLKKSQRQVMNALERGKRAEDFHTSWERRFLELASRDPCYAVAYNQCCYIFSEKDICITVYKLPAWFGKRKPCDGKEMIRNAKKYNRVMSNDSEIDPIHNAI